MRKRRPWTDQKKGGRGLVLVGMHLEERWAWMSCFSVDLGKTRVHQNGRRARRTETCDSSPHFRRGAWRRSQPPTLHHLGHSAGTRVPAHVTFGACGIHDGRDLLVSVFRPYVFLSHFVLTEDMKEPDDQDTDGGRSGSRSDGKQAHRSTLNGK